MLCLSGFELYPRWVPLTLNNKEIRLDRRFKPCRVSFLNKQESLREFYRGHFCLGNLRGRVVFINKFVGRHENLFYCKYSLEMKTRCNE